MRVELIARVWKGGEGVENDIYVIRASMAHPTPRGCVGTYASQKISCVREAVQMVWRGGMRLDDHRRLCGTRLDLMNGELRTRCDDAVSYNVYPGTSAAYRRILITCYAQRSHLVDAGGGTYCVDQGLLRSRPARTRLVPAADLDDRT